MTNKSTERENDMAGRRRKIGDAFMGISSLLITVLIIGMDSSNLYFFWG